MDLTERKSAEVTLHRAYEELEEHRVELETQNEELRGAYTALEASEEKYRDLYEFAPLGYFTLDARGEILEANLAGASLLGRERGRLIGARFGLFLERESLKRSTSSLPGRLSSDMNEACDIRLERAEGRARLGAARGEERRRRRYAPAPGCRHRYLPPGERGGEGAPGERGAVPAAHRECLGCRRRPRCRGAYRVCKPFGETGQRVCTRRTHRNADTQTDAPRRSAAGDGRPLYCRHPSGQEGHPRSSDAAPLGRLAVF